MEQKQPETRRVKNLNRATDTLSVILVQEVRDINTRQKAARKENADAGTMKSIKEATAVLKDLTTVSRTLSEGDGGPEKQGGGVISIIVTFSLILALICRKVMILIRKSRAAA